VDVEAERVEPDADGHLGRGQPRVRVVALEREFDGPLERVVAHGEGGLLVEAPAPADLEAHDVVADELDSQLLAVEAGVQPAVGLLDVVDALEADEVARIDAAARYAGTWAVAWAGVPSRGSRRAVLVMRVHFVTRADAARRARYDMHLRRAFRNARAAGSVPA
jgi:hypothetical protein